MQSPVISAVKVHADDSCVVASRYEIDFIGTCVQHERAKDLAVVRGVQYCRIGPVEISTNDTAVCTYLVSAII